jgi:hypothetical protein
VRKLLKLAVPAVILLSLVAFALPAGATPPTGYGFDNTPHLVTLGGSDTTYWMMNGLTTVYNRSLGCQVITSGVNANNCVSDPNPEPNTGLGDYQHDTLANLNPTGSSFGILSMLDSSCNVHYNGASPRSFNGTQRTTAADGTTTGPVPGPATATVTSATANFQASDVGQPIAGAGIPAGASILSVTNVTTAIMSANATATANNVVFTIGTNGQVSCTNVDTARSSRSPSATELSNVTGWGYAFDGIQVITFDPPANYPLSPAVTCDPGDGGAHLPVQISPQKRGSYEQCAYQNHTWRLSQHLTFNDLFHIYNCDYTHWSDIPNSGITPQSADDGPIVPWSMNSSSGTYNTFRDFVRSPSDGSPNQPTFDPNAKQVDYISGTVDANHCVRMLHNGGGGNPATNPLENNVKPLFNDVSISTTPSSVDNPINWIWWGSFGDMNNFPYKSNFATNPADPANTTYLSRPLPVDGKLVSNFTISSTNPAIVWPMTRVLWQVTKDSDATCSVVNAGVCDFSGGGGPALPAPLVGNDLNVSGANGGTGGAVREFIRFLCRPRNISGTDPFTGTSNSAEINGAIVGAGFQTLPANQNSNGTPCRVVT